MVYQAIQNYGIIGNLYTTALVGLHGSIDWFCFPNHDSPSLFAALLDERQGGYFKIAPATDSGYQHEQINFKQLYWSSTNVLLTRFLTAEGVGEIRDFMPVELSPDEAGYQSLIRRVVAVRGCMKFRMECFPAFNYAQDSHELELTDTGVCFRSAQLSLGLVTNVELQVSKQGVIAEFTLKQGEAAVFVLRQIEPGCSCGPAVGDREAHQLFKNTVQYWRHWLSKCTYRGRWREMVERSALILKLLTYEPTGAIIAAPTCSLPEQIGGQRNWDYRYTWIRDAAFTLYALLRIGFTEEAARFMNWIEQRCHERDPDGSLQIVYGIDGRHQLTETTLQDLKGYRNSHPVRVGNDAFQQLQLDIYGELMDSVYLYNKHGAPISYDFWTYLRQLLNWVCDNWQRQDESIWEVRNGQSPFVYSKIMCWVALDRGLRLADKRSFPADRDRWLKVRDQIYEEVLTEGWSESRQAFVQAYGSESLDASSLIMPLVFFLAPSDPRMLKTLDAITQPPEAGGLLAGGLVYRYNADEASDGLDGKEGTFNICTFWLVEALTRAGRLDRHRLNEARLLFEEMLSYANHLGLYAEQTSLSGEALGNFPQAFTHLALISAAWNLNKELGAE